jgi:hypothetical protein
MKDKYLFDCWKAYRGWLGALGLQRNNLYSINYYAIKKSREAREMEE